jgi:hypothetical protein
VVLGGIGVGASGFFELADLDGTNGFVVNGTDANDNFGWSVAGVGDLNNDGIDDIAIGANGGDPNGSASGEAYIVFGSATVGASGSIDATALTGTSGFVINGIDPGDNTGRVVASAGDVNGDGVSDLLIGSFWADPNGQADAGECAIVFGATGIGASGSMELSSLTGANGYILRGVAAGDWSGFAASGLGDVNDDGADDILIGARSADPNGLTSAGESYVVLGGPGVGAGGTIELAGLSGGDGFTVEGVTANDWSGFAVGGAGDLNSDGIADIMIGARNGDPNGLDSGEIYIVFGQSPAPACAGDVNGDGDTNAADFTILAGSFGAMVPPGTGADLNGDGIVNAADFTILAGDLGCG